MDENDLDRGLREGDLLLVPQVVKLLPVGKSLIYDMCKEGTLRSFRAGASSKRRGRLVVFRSSVEEYVRNQALKSVTRPDGPDTKTIDDVLAEMRGD